MKEAKLEKALVFIQEYLQNASQEEINGLIEQVDEKNLKGHLMKDYKKLLKKYGLWDEKSE